MTDLDDVRERLNARLEQQEAKLAAAEERGRQEGYVDAWELLHQSAACGHARAYYRDPKFGTPDYAGEERCEACEAKQEAEARCKELEAQVERLSTDAFREAADRAAGIPIEELNNAYDEEKQARRAAEAQRDRAVEVLRPFARVAQQVDANPHIKMLGDETPWQGAPHRTADSTSIRLGDIRASNALIAELEPTDDT